MDLDLVLSSSNPSKCLRTLQPASGKKDNSINAKGSNLHAAPAGSFPKRLGTYAHCLCLPLPKKRELSSERSGLGIVASIRRTCVLAVRCSEVALATACVVQMNSQV